MKEANIRILINSYKWPFFYLLISLLKKKRYELYEIIQSDTFYWSKKNTCSIWDIFCCCVIYKNFVSVFNTRIKNDRTLYYYSRISFRLNDNIEIHTNDIGPGFVLLHKFGAVVRAKSIGKNVVVLQGVTIGEGGDRNSKDNQNIPTIGNNVTIGANAIVIGNIMIGDNVTIGAGAVITKSIPDNSIAVGNPQRIIK